jgi:hypothetical protein
MGLKEQIGAGLNAQRHIEQKKLQDEKIREKEQKEYYLACDRQLASELAHEILLLNQYIQQSRLLYLLDEAANVLRGKVELTQSNNKLWDNHKCSDSDVYNLYELVWNKQKVVYGEGIGEFIPYNIIRDKWQKNKVFDAWYGVTTKITSQGIIYVDTEPLTPDRWLNDPNLIQATLVDKIVITRQQTNVVHEIPRPVSQS